MNQIIRTTTLVFLLIVASDSSFAASSREVLNSHAITTGAVEEIDLLGSCTNGTDTAKREYVISLKGFEMEEQIRLINKGSNGRNWKYKVAELSGSNIKLPDMTLSGGIGGGRLNHGLWIERVKTGERHQLNRLLGTKRCNSKGLVSAKFTNLWVSLDVPE